MESSSQTKLGSDATQAVNTTSSAVDVMNARDALHHGENEEKAHEQVDIPKHHEEEKEKEAEKEEEEDQEDSSSSSSSPCEEDEDNDDNTDTEDEDSAPFASDEEALATRAIGLKHYNEHHYEDALDIQYRVLRHFEKKYGATSPICGPYFLDYGLSQLRLLQTRSSVEAALEPLDQEALKTCFINLDVARVCFQKQEEQRGEEDIETQLSLAEVHNAIAQLHVEREDFDSALKEYESELLTYRFIQQEKPEMVPHGRLAAVLYGMADCYMKEGDFEEAESRFTNAIAEIEGFPPGTIADELIAELRELRDDAAAMKGGKYRELQECIQAQFAAKEAEMLPTAQEFYGAGVATEEQEEEEKGEEERKEKQPSQSLQHPYLSHLPGDSEYSALSMPQSLTNPVRWNEHSNSMSLSLFPPQVAGRSPEASNSQPVHHVVARRKPKPQPQSQQQQTSQQQQQQQQQLRGNDGNSLGESETKRLRTESCS
ncbi:uncharacterized protein TM35_000063840 [Trypanosoma theileri]|uniref:Tetratricopeptide SHNi-TPR domain-containing protein n=1 Tax=Trypanosoma theileri TaxID=67003 RepID=A0A1X0P488_9TRYP|nr:uncharacterized protein TM35_000063840 [Trypanosoma theileri]ORC91379.1 hypothetical protein TM35_000063840 [Trypanosoma theileri]